MKTAREVIAQYCGGPMPDITETGHEDAAAILAALDAAGYVIIERRLLDLRHPMSGVQFHTPSEDEK